MVQKRQSFEDTADILDNLKIRQMENLKFFSKLQNYSHREIDANIWILKTADFESILISGRIREFKRLTLRVSGVCVAFRVLKSSKILKPESFLG